MWKQQSIRGDGVPQPLSLYSTRSEDSGYTFNDAELVVEEPVVWREIVTAGEDHLHLLWQSQDTMTTLWDKVSLDGGRSWQFPQGLPVEGKLATVTRDLVGRLHLVGVGTGTLDHWLWDGSRWQPEAPLAWALSSQTESSVELLAAAVNKQGKMVVVLAVQTSAGDTAERMLLYSTRTLDLPAEQIAIQEVPTQTLLPPTLTPSTPSTEPSSSPASTLISEPTRSPGQTDRIETNDPITPFTMALVPVAILLLSVLGIMIRRASQAKDR